MSQAANDVKVRDLISDAILELHVTSLKPFFGSADEALRLAKHDADQFTIVAIKAYRGDPWLRTSMEFEVSFENGYLGWQTYNAGLAATVQFEEYCRLNRPLIPLLSSAKLAAAYKKALSESIKSLTLPN